MDKPFTHRVISPMLASETDCPPLLLSAIWPTFDGWTVQHEGKVCLVSAPASAPAPVDLGPLVKVELVPSE